MSIYLGDPSISVGFYIWKSMIPALLGNVVGGCLLVATVYWYLNLTGEGSVEVDGVAYGETQHFIGRSDDSESPTRRASSNAEKSAEDIV